MMVPEQHAPITHGRRLWPDAGGRRAHRRGRPAAAGGAVAGGRHPRRFDAMLADLAARRRAEIDRAIKARDWPRAETLLVAEIERTPKPADLLKKLAGVFMNDRKPLNAAIAIKKAETFGPLDAATRLQLALAYIAMRRGDWARPELERLAAAEPLNTVYAYWLARLDYDSGRYDAAIARLRTVVAAGARLHPGVRQPGALLRGAEPARGSRPPVPRGDPPHARDAARSGPGRS